MEVRVRERLVGALVLVGIVVLLVPAILTGGPKREPAAPSVDETRSVEVDLDQGLPAADADVLVPEPDAVESPVIAVPTQVPARSAAPAPAPAPRAPHDRPEAGAGPGAQAAAGPGQAETQAPLATGERAAWAVQLGAFSSRDKAERLVADLRKRGYAAFVLEYRAAGRVLHRVRVGPEQDRERAVAIAERLRKDGFQTVVAPHP